MTKVIEDIELKDLATIIAGLVREGVSFRAYPDQFGARWRIELTGGY
jgi:hypothetical protein